MKVNQLKPLLRKKDLSTSGRKDVLIDQIQIQKKHKQRIEKTLHCTSASPSPLISLVQSPLSSQLPVQSPSPSFQSERGKNWIDNEFIQMIHIIVNPSLIVKT